MDIKRHICIHGHFYQPSRANPWLETIEIQEDAYPFHDWNEKINAECYMTNSGSHILNQQKKIKKILNNYSRMSFNFGPILLSWLKSHDIDTYMAIINADKEAQERFGGHGSAIAQIYNHIIMPLANRKDKYIQTCWAVKDFEKNFGRNPEGIWLSETAVDYETLEVLSEFDIKFTILSPNQALKVRRITADNNMKWTDLSSGNINTRTPYLCRLANNRSIVIFFYDNEISTKISFGNLLEDGEFFVRTLKEAPFAAGKDMGNPYTISHIPEILCVASDGETFGHHHRFGDMALAYALDTFESNYPQTLTVFGQYIENYQPLFEVEIKQNSSWSCSHGTCRWTQDCGCSAGSGQNKGWNQKWRVPLRQAVDYISKKAGIIYEQAIKNFINTDIADIWEPVYKYIDVINNRSIENISEFIKPFIKTRVSLFFNNNNRKNKFLLSRLQVNNSVINILKLLEMYRQSMLMQSSDGWFFDDISRIEAIQIMRHACRTMELIKDITSEDLEFEFKQILENAKSNIESYRDGKYIYEKYAKAASYGFEKVMAFFAFEMLFKENLEELFNYRVKSLKTEKIKMDHGEVVAAMAEVASIVTLEQAQAVMAAYNFKNKDILSPKSASSFVKMLKKKKTNVPVELTLSIRRIAADKKTDSDKKKERLEKLLQSYFLQNHYTLKDFLKDRQVFLAEEVLLKETENIRPLLSRLFNNYEEVLKDLSEKKLQNFFLDGIFPSIEEFIGEVLLYYKLKEKGMSSDNLNEIRNIIIKTSTIDFINKESFNILATKKTDEITDLFIKDYKNIEILKILTDFIKIMREAGIEPNLWKMQNKIISIRDKVLKDMPGPVNNGNKQWAKSFKVLLDILDIAL